MQSDLDTLAGCAARIMQWADELARHTGTPGMLTRTYLTPSHHAAAELIVQWMCDAGLHAFHRIFFTGFRLSRQPRKAQSHDNPTD